MEQFKKNKILVLWTKLKDGDVDALGDLYDLYVDELFVYGMQFSSDKSHVMDAIHDLFLNLYKYRQNLSKTDYVDYYLMRALKNTILNNTHSKLREISFENQNEFKAPQHSEEERLIAHELQTERSCKLAKALSVLSKKQRKGVLLRFTEDHTYEEIAEIMSISVTSSRTMIYRAIKVLRKQMLLLIFVILLLFF